MLVCMLVSQVIRCELSGWQKQLYKQIQNEGALTANTRPGTNRDPLDNNLGGSKGLSNIFMQLRKVCLVDAQR